MYRRSSDSYRPTPLFWRLLFAIVLATLALVNHARAANAQAGACGCAGACAHVVVVEPEPASWVFAPGRYTHDPDTGARVAQYQRSPAIEPLDDPRNVTSGYSRSRTVLRGGDGSVDTYYRVRSFGNGYGGLDAQGERIQDAVRGAPVVPNYGGFYGGGYGFPAFGPLPGYGPGYGPGAGFGGGYFPGYGAGPIGRPAYGQPDPDMADGYREPTYRTPDRQFYRNTPWHNRGGNLGPRS